MSQSPTQVSELTWIEHPVFSQQPYPAVFSVGFVSDLYYIIVLITRVKVEQTLFTFDIHRILQQSEPLQGIFGISNIEGKIVEGTKERPIKVPGVTVQEFEAFLEWMNHV